MAAASFPSSLLKYGELLGTRLDWLMVCSKNLQRTHNDNKIEQFLTVIMMSPSPGNPNTADKQMAAETCPE